jgi:phosphatidylglycerophosphatase A
MKSTAKIFSTFFGIGFIPIAPGTVASFIVVLLYKFFLYKLNWPVFLISFCVLFIAGVMTATMYSAAVKKEDPSSIVIDEVAGQFLALFLLAPNWSLLLINFFLFRFFDVFKPLLIKRAEKYPRGWGIMMDDIVSGIYAGIMTNLFWLGKVYIL